MRGCWSIASLTPVLLVACLAESVKAQVYEQQQYQQQRPRPEFRDIGRKDSGRFWGMMKTGAVGALASWSFGQLYYRWQAKRLKQAHQKKSDKLIASYQQRKEAIVAQFGEAYQALEVNADYVDSLIAQLEGILQHPETDPNKRKVAEFKLPDANNDNKISRAEFEAYLRSYFAAHPELADVEYPSFDDFDLDGSGLVSFAEWKQFIEELEKKQLEEERLAGGAKDLRM
ncbi:hypothetical protein NSK_000622 [Nannochloropsis salina CCMP1776]|uniref:EF-hand domain-containing protein n=1 Tax=Nannochloropsis salina CCMP1776 TaxID=1027361 RepID=A0A4D9DDS9_9STRA|nr:hypothetical protein NSK_000622 [Nannochloropsis salina CCMP1776]|eukprot:TFJ88273.1 hypothetical protein NSK_000622 [Nannochloropsis salina CCMP1776]